MKVETYEIDEQETHPECESGALELIEQLGLEGQKTLTNGDSTNRVPYRQMTKDEFFVYRTLCPTSVPMTKYAASPIPLRVLQVAAHAQSLEFFQDLLVWDRERADIHDPVLVGTVATGQYSKAYYILARWAEHLDEWPAMVKQAVHVAKERAIVEAKQGLRDANEKLRRAEEAETLTELQGLTSVALW